MGEKYIPRIGDVIIYDNNSYVVMDMKVHESYHPGEYYYSRDYYLLEKDILNEYLRTGTGNFIPYKKSLYKRVVFEGFESELPDIKKVNDPLYKYKVEIADGFCVEKRIKC